MVLNSERRATARMIPKPVPFLLPVLLLLLANPRTATAHCDTMDGPVVKAAAAALERRDVTPVLKWVKAEDEQAIRAAFAKALEARQAGPAARELADRSFFETLVRIHREGEGVPYTGLRPAGTDPEPGIRAADQALDGGSPDELLRSMTARLTAEIRQRYVLTVERRKHAEESVEAGREYVEAYVSFIHFVERIQEDLAAQHAAHAAHAGAPSETTTPSRP